MTEQELDLLQFSSGSMAQPRARAPQVMRRDASEAEFGGVARDDMPNQAFGQAVKRPSFDFGFFVLAVVFLPCLPIAQPPPTRLPKSVRPGAPTRRAFSSQMAS